VSAADQAAVGLGSVLSFFVGLWSLASLALPFGVIGGGFGALFGLAFGALAMLGRATGRWRKTALAGITVSSLVFILAAAELVYLVLTD
jgi:hypothetical protein